MDDERPFPNGGNMRVAIGALLGLLVASPLAAQDFPVQIALFTPIQIVKAEKGVSAIRFNFLYSVNKSVKYVDLGVINVTSGGESSGLQFAFAAINKGGFTGWQGSPISITQGRFEGLQTGFFTSAKGGGKGLQWGAINTAGSWEGLQVGFINHAQNLHGVQIGIINIIKTGGQFPVFPIVNWSF